MNLSTFNSLIGQINKLFDWFRSKQFINRRLTAWSMEVVVRGIAFTFKCWIQTLNALAVLFFWLINNDDELNNDVDYIFRYWLVFIVCRQFFMLTGGFFFRFFWRFSSCKRCIFADSAISVKRKNMFNISVVALIYARRCIDQCWLITMQVIWEIIRYSIHQILWSCIKYI